jgi:hypothetical protein
LDIYQDDGKLGDFAEIECHGRPIGGATGRSELSDRFVNWFYFGDRRAVKVAAENLLGLAPNIGTA